MELVRTAPPGRYIALFTTAWTATVALLLTGQLYRWGPLLPSLGDIDLPLLERLRLAAGRDLLFPYGALWLAGLVGIRAVWRRLRRQHAERHRLDNELRTSEARRQGLLALSSEAIVTTDREGRIIEFNPAAERIFGYRLGEARGRELAELILPVDQRARYREGLTDYLSELSTGQEQQRLEIRAVHADGRLFPAELSVTRTDTGVAPLFTAVLRDLGGLRATERALRESMERYTLTARGASDALWDWDIGSGQARFSPRWAEMVGADMSEIDGTLDCWFRRVHPQDLPRLEEALSEKVQALADGFTVEHRLWHPQGRYRWVSLRATVAADAEGKPRRVAGSFSDIDDIRATEERLRREALQDPLTGLSSRALLVDRLERAVQRIRRYPDYRFALLLINLDRFQTVNEGLGHHSADRLLTAVAGRLQAVLGVHDTLARLGGDEFGLLLEGMRESGGALAMAERCQAVCGETVNLDGQEIVLSASIGIVSGDARYADADDMLRDAATALHRAKRDGRDRYALFEPGMHERAVARLRLESDLRHALERGELHLAFQPVVEFERGALVGFEALLRWQHPQLGNVSPLEFIPLAEETGLILPIGEWALRAACRQLAQWHQAAPDLWVSVNVSPRQLTDSDLPELVCEAIAQSGLPPASLKLELTESMLLARERSAMNALHSLRDVGVRLCIDDFGTGYSAMSYLHDFPLDTLKVDRAFVSRIEGDGQATVSAILALAASLKLDVVAEGVENAGQLARLKALECPQAQGYFFSRPLPAGEAEVLVQSERRWAV